MTTEQQQRLFNYFHQEHDITLMYGDYIEIDNILSTPSDKSMSDLSLYDRMFAMVSYVAGTNDADVINGYTQTFVAIAEEHATNQVAKATAEHKEETIEFEKAQCQYEITKQSYQNEIDYLKKRIKELEANQPKWISVDEKEKPIPFVTVAVLHKKERENWNPDIRTGYYEGSTFVSHGSTANVSHWMKLNLPENPKQ